MRAILSRLVAHDMQSRVALAAGGRFELKSQHIPVNQIVQLQINTNNSHPYKYVHVCKIMRGMLLLVAIFS